MNCVIVYYSGDGYTCGSNITLPLEYESTEALLIDFEQALVAAILDGRWEFQLAGHYFQVRDFAGESVREFGPPFRNTNQRAIRERKIKELIHLPTVLSLEEWFIHYSKK